jgi:NAD(P)-dependent dehydrogenase (short-subunit alcohol dehydrogenase family)
MRGAAGIDEYVALAEQEAFDIEYWLLEEAKLRRMPKPGPLSGRIAYVTGGAGAIGRATAERLLADGAVVVIADIAGPMVAKVEAELGARYGKDNVRGAIMDVTNEADVARSFALSSVEFGGADIVVCSAGIASSASVEDTSLELWQRNLEVLATGYFLVAREAFRLLRRESTGGSVVFVASKNALVASTQASAYCTAKSAELHLARCLAMEGAGLGIRVNSVNPDAVLSGSQIWSGAWREERARAYGIQPDKLEQFYRDRSMLKQNVMPEDVAEAIHFFASDRSRNSTGNILNVDAGNSGAFTR